MRWVQTATQAPHRCAAVPFIGHTSQRGFIDTGSEMNGWDQHVYVSVESVEQMAQIIDWSPPATVDALQRLVVAQERRITKLEEQRITKLEEQLAEADLVADSFDVVKRRKQRQKETV